MSPSDNPRIQTIDEELEHSLDIFLVSTNFEFTKHIECEMRDLEPVQQMRKILALFHDYAEVVYYKDKIHAIISMYTGEIFA